MCAAATSVPHRAGGGGKVPAPGNNFPTSADEGQGVVGACHCDDVAEYQQGGEPGGDALAAGFAALDGYGAEHDVENQREKLGGEPAVHQRVLLDQHGE